MINLKRLFVPICILFVLAGTSSYAQDKLYAMDADWEGTELKKAKYLLRVKKINDTSWQWDSYAILGPLIKSETFKEEEGNIASGAVYFYNKNGRIDSIHNYRNGLAHGEWYYLNDTGRSVRLINYSNGIKVNERDLLAEDAERKQKGALDSLDKNRGDKDEIESEFPGQNKGWAKYLSKNFNYPERAINNEIQGEVWIQFVVDTVGNVIEPRICKSVEFSLDEEALRIIRSSPRWEPAVQFGRKVKSYKKQPIIFKLK